MLKIGLSLIKEDVMDASRGEIKIHEILEESGLNYEMEYSFP